MPQMTEHSKFPSRAGIPGGAGGGASRRALGGNSVFIFYRKKYTPAISGQFSENASNFYKLFIYKLLYSPKFTVTKRLPAGVSDEVMPAFLFPCGAHSTIIAEGPAIQ